MSENMFIIQYLRKSKLGKEYLAGYLNMILKSLINTNLNENFEIHIRGSCWSKKENTAGNLVSKVFNNVDFTKSKVYLHNDYKGFNRKGTLNALKNAKNIGKVFSGEDTLDHSKEILIQCNKQTIFYMSGSSNFSNQTYVKRDGNINQSDISFIRYTTKTKELIHAIIENNDNTKLVNFFEIDNENIDIGSDSLYTNYKIQNYVNIISLPYSGMEDILSEYTKEFNESRVIGTEYEV